VYTPALQCQRAEIVGGVHLGSSDQIGVAQPKNLRDGEDVAYVRRQPVQLHANVIAQIFCVGVQLASPSFEDEVERNMTSGGLVQHPQHVVEVGEHDDEVLRVASLDMEVVPWDVEVVHNPTLHINQGDRQPSTTDNGHQS
jgi:hypothetical protein